MGKIKSKTWSRKPSTTQSGVLDYKSLTAKKRRLSGKTKRKRAMARDAARAKDAVRQYVDIDNRVNFDVAAQLLARNPRMTLKEAKRLSENT